MGHTMAEEFKYDVLLSHSSKDNEAAPSPPEIPGYKLLQPIGRGGFGIVWLAVENVDPNIRRAIKILPKDAARATTATELDGLRDYRSLCDGHPHLLQIQHV